MNEENGFNSAENKKDAAQAELVQRWKDHIGRSTDRYSESSVKPKGVDARFELILTIPTLVDPETGKLTDVPQYRSTVLGALDLLGNELGADNRDRVPEERRETDLTGNDVEAVFRQATLAGNPVTGQPYSTPVDITIKITQPTENYPDDLPGMSAMVTMTESQAMAEGGAVSHVQSNV